MSQEHDQHEQNFDPMTRALEVDPGHVMARQHYERMLIELAFEECLKTLRGQK